MEADRVHLVEHANILHGRYLMVDPDFLGAFVSMGFKTSEEITGRSSLSNVFPPSARCGIYILHFADGRYYVGQAIDVVRRYGQHRLTYRDIQRISFKKTAQRDLAREEIDTIGELERLGVELRNISLVSIPHWESDFDQIMTAADQQRWLNDLGFTDFTGTRGLAPQLRERYHQNYLRYQSMPYSHEITEVLRTYVRKCIPVPVRSEMAFWCCTCLPSYAQQKAKLYSRFNIYWQEVFAVTVTDSKFYFSWQLASSPFDDQADAFLERVSVKSLFERFLHFLHAQPRGAASGKVIKPFEYSRNYSTLGIGDRTYQTGGSDQINFYVTTIDEALQLLHDEEILKAIRLFNLRLCRKGGSIFSRYHCLDLADDLLSPS